MLLNRRSDSLLTTLSYNNSVASLDTGLGGRLPNFIRIAEEIRHGKHGLTRPESGGRPRQGGVDW